MLIFSYANWKWAVAAVRGAARAVGSQICERITSMEVQVMSVLRDEYSTGLPPDEVGKTPSTSSWVR